MHRWLSIIGIGEQGVSGLTSAARTLVDLAETLIGPPRQLALFSRDGREQLAWPTPFSALVEEIKARRGRRVCVLSTGDPLHYGVGATLVQHIAMAEMTIIPAPSAFSLACARIGWPVSEITPLTVHGRPLELVHPAIQPGARLVILSNGPETPGMIAELLCRRGYGESRLMVLEHMDGAHERQLIGTASHWSNDIIAPFNTIAVECIAGPDAVLLPRTPGLPDDAFIHDGQLTKREVRSVTLAMLQPIPAQLLWDVGAGCGSIAIEFMRTDPRCRAIAIESNPDRASKIADNASALGVPLIQIVPGAAPAALAGLESPDAIFIGGGITTDGLFETCWQALRSGGRLVANAVTLEGEQRLFSLCKSYGGELSRLDIAHAEAVGRFTGWKSLMPVTQWVVKKR